MVKRHEEPPSSVLASHFAQQRVVVVGDLMLDEYLTGTTHRISPEGPVLVVNVSSEEAKPGGAANVANNLLALGASVDVVGVVGNDACAGRLCSKLRQCGAVTDGIVVDEGRPTTVKTRVVAQHQQVLRFDRELSDPISDTVRQRLMASVAQKMPEVTAIVVSDYQKGVLTSESVRDLVHLSIRYNIPLVANAKPVSAHWFSGARAVSLNQREAEEVVGQRMPLLEPDVGDFGAALRRELNVGILVITRGSLGLCFWTEWGECATVAAHPVEVFDVAGAGDTTIAVFTLALISGSTSHQAAQLANRAGACAVGKRGVATVTVQELLSLKLANSDDLVHPYRETSA